MLRTNCMHLMCLASLGTLPIWGILESRPAVAEVKTTAILTVVLFNSSNASHDTLVRTKKGVNGIFSKSGIRLTWMDCPPLPGSVAPLCREESAPGEIRVRIIDRQFKNYFRTADLGSPSRRFGQPSITSRLCASPKLPPIPIPMFP